MMFLGSTFGRERGCYLNQAIAVHPEVLGSGHCQQRLNDCQLHIWICAITALANHCNHLLREHLNNMSAAMISMSAPLLDSSAECCTQPSVVILSNQSQTQSKVRQVLGLDPDSNLDTH